MDENNTGSVGNSKSSILCPKDSLHVEQKIKVEMNEDISSFLALESKDAKVLCDALTYVGKYKPKYVIDMATLTGAVVVALGRHASGVMANDQHLADMIIASGEESGDRAWQLPLWDEHQSCTKTS